MIRVLIVDDSITQREIFRRLFEHDEELSVVGEACNGRDAITQVEQLRPDVVLMDIHMPEMDGIEATLEIMRRCPVPIVVASATLRKRDVDLAMQAYQAGAVAVIEKPEGAVLLHLKKMAPELRRELIAAAASKVRLLPLVTRTTSRALQSGKPVPMPATSTGSQSRPSPVAPAKPALAATLRVIGVCASTGGPPVLAEIFKSLPNPLPVPLFLVQHISHGFEEGFARWLVDTTGQSVAIAVDGQRITPGVWLSPGGRHLRLGSGWRFDLPRGQAAEIHCPSGNPMFESLAVFGTKAAGVLLTGMGDDGATGLLSLRQAGGTTIIQSEESCLIWGMPRVAQQLGAAERELTPTEIAATITRMLQ